MSRSERWQKFYSIYCKFSGLMVALVGALLLIGVPGLQSAAQGISYAMYAAMVTGADLLLWLISLGVWFSRRQSTTLWAILGWGAALLAVKFLNLIFFFGLTGGV
jgi:hypothetical protein